MIVFIDFSYLLKFASREFKREVKNGIRLFSVTSVILLDISFFICFFYISWEGLVLRVVVAKMGLFLFLYVGLIEKSKKLFILGCIVLKGSLKLYLCFNEFYLRWGRFSLLCLDDEEYKRFKNWSFCFFLSLFIR